MDKTLFDYKKIDDFIVKHLKKNKNYNILKVEFQSAFPTGIPICDKVQGLYFRVNDSKKAVIVIHGISMVSTTKYFCWRLATKGFSSFMLIMPYAPVRIPKKRPISKIPQNIDWSEVFKRGLIQSVIDVRKTIDFLEKENQKIGILGISLGATISALVQAIDDRITSGIYIVGGADLANMLWDSRDFIARIYKKKLFGSITREQLALQWKDIDPLTYAKPQKNVMMINAKFDTSVRPIYTIKLWESLGKPEIHWLRCAHFFIIHLLYVKSLILKHFRKTLA
ncbi:MAG: hypothetical protein NC906_07895 [Candidatus Omnitrophica bacterium]|nr:hypothetical protein [Candidatus Omnitrophota bacterium]